MSLLKRIIALAATSAVLLASQAMAEPKTVCTITVNSPDERETFRRNLPPDDYRFVELVERGRPDWLASACRKGIRCDVLLISGHFDGGDEFYSDRVDARESLPVVEMERAACSDSCPGLFSQLKEVYLFGCNTLNPESAKSASAEIGRSLVRAGRSPAEAEQVSKLLDERHAESNRDRMRLIFKDVPVIYGFSSKAPLGRAAAPLLDRYFRDGGAAEIASGRPSARLLGLFAPVSMTVARGSTADDPQAAYRGDVCHFVDDRLAADRKVAFVHALLRRDMAEVRMFLDRLERYVGSLDDADRRAPPVAKALAEIASDETVRSRYLAFERDADRPDVRARMIALAARLGWLAPADAQAELARMIRNRVAQGDVGPDDADLVCTLNRDHTLDAALPGARTAASGAKDVGRSALLACLGDADARARTVDALTGRSERDVEIAQVYLRHRPIADAAELRGIALRVSHMKDAEAQIRALDTLAQQGLSDRESLESLTRLFPVAKTVNVQRAIAGILIRSDYRVIAKPELVRALREKRLKSPDGRDLIDVLIRRMQASLGDEA
jgi:hypothetical protein